jgi:preprotein translocase subunit SecA
LSGHAFFPIQDVKLLHFLTRVFGSRNERLVRSYGRYVRAANEFEPTIQALSDEDQAR